MDAHVRLAQMHAKGRQQRMDDLIERRCDRPKDAHHELRHRPGQAEAKATDLHVKAQIAEQARHHGLHELACADGFDGAGIDIGLCKRKRRVAGVGRRDIGTPRDLDEPRVDNARIGDAGLARQVRQARTGRLSMREQCPAAR